MDRKENAMSGFLVTYVSSKKTVISYINSAGQVIELTSKLYHAIGEKVHYTVNETYVSHAWQ